MAVIAYYYDNILEVSQREPSFGWFYNCLRQVSLFINEYYKKKYFRKISYGIIAREECSLNWSSRQKY